MNSKIQMEVYNPSGAIQIGSVHAPRLDTLRGKTIGEVSNGKHDWTFDFIRRLLQERFPDAKIIPYTEFPFNGTEVGIDTDGIEQIVEEKGCDAVIVGNAV